MKVLQVNSVCGIGSTGRICGDLARSVTLTGGDCRIAYGRSDVVPEDCRGYAMAIGTKKDVLVHGLSSRILDNTGFGSRGATEAWIRQVETYDPDVVHLHNLHGYYLHLPTLFAYLKEAGKPVVWTLHDCWAFTGHCAHYDFVRCDRWKTECHHCPQKGRYPQSVLRDGSRENYRRKRELFTELDNLTLVTPSKWLAQQAEMSFLGKYPVQVIPNGIDLEVFRPDAGGMEFPSELRNRKVVLGVASVWEERKGLETLLNLAQSLPEDYRLVLIGLDEKQLRALPEGILGIQRTNSIRELAAWYARADVYVNASLEESMGMTTLEAVACGAPVVVMDATALPEVAKALGGAVVRPGDMAGLREAVIDMADRKGRENLRDLSGYSRQAMCQSYLNIYDGICKGTKP